MSKTPKINKVRLTYDGNTANIFHDSDSLYHGSRDGIMEQVFNCIRDNVPLDTVHIPHSDVFYVREALEAQFPDRDISLAQTEEYMRYAGWTDTNEYP